MLTTVSFAIVADGFFGDIIQINISSMPPQLLRPLGLEVVDKARDVVLLRYVALSRSNHEGGGAASTKVASNEPAYYTQRSSL